LFEVLNHFHQEKSMPYEMLQDNASGNEVFMTELSGMKQL